MKTESSETHSVFHAQNNILSLLSVLFECILYLTRIMSWGSLTHTCFKALARVTAHVISCGSTTLRTTSNGPTALLHNSALLTSQEVKGKWTVFISQKSVQLSFFKYSRIKEIQKNTQKPVQRRDSYLCLLNVLQTCIASKQTETLLCSFYSSSAIKGVRLSLSCFVPL